MPTPSAAWPGAPQCQRADLALALTTLWLGRLCNRMDYAAGFIFMRRMGSAALTATGPVLNVLPLAVHIDARRRWRSWRCASPLS
jgi:enterobactin synthetase component F